MTVRAVLLRFNTFNQNVRLIVKPSTVIRKNYATNYYFEGYVLKTVFIDNRLLKDHRIICINKSYPYVNYNLERKFTPYNFDKLFLEWFYKQNVVEEKVALINSNLGV